MNRDEILHRLQEHKPALRQRFGLRSLDLFGSYARGEETDGSDVDILVEFDETPTLFEFVRVQEHLAELLGVPVDLVMREALRPRIGQRILQEAVPI